MTDLLINLLASVIAGTAVWLAQFAVRRRHLYRLRAFFGLTGSTTALLVTGRHFSSPSDLSVHRRDVAALVELATLIRGCGVRADLVSGTDVRAELGRVTEFCVGGPAANPRAAVHFRAALPGVCYEPNHWTIGGVRYANTAGSRYAVLARFRAPSGGRPVFLLGGLASEGNLAAARLLAEKHAALLRSYGEERSFCLVLRVREPDAYGTDDTEVAADVSDIAFVAPVPGED
ncbi:hypothetical protein [Actinoplanes sp. N902-109]|uniref:hypothetical protein n=1 Tax=Actinoplanes sp. (strain N902-109) TaxID=649831 RepID=UPI00032946A0|nr:hypothetical protein [Actinoplanes sp. N902-109]AGL20026.1 hypothetical protein L083_6516 [Actinoplanes sp. N902-109]